jgi:hypothetical protein
MPEKITGNVEILDGRLIVKDSTDKDDLIPDFLNSASIVVKDSKAGIIIDSPRGPAIRLLTRSSLGNPPAARIFLGADDLPGILTLIDNRGKAKFVLDGSGTSLMRVINESEKDVLRFDAKSSALDVGGVGSGGDIRLRNQNDKVTIQLEGESGDLKILDDAGAMVIHLDRKARLLKLKGDLEIFDDSGAHVIHFDRGTRDLKFKGDLEILDDSGGVVIHLDRKARDIKLKGADCAEVFAAHDASALEPGSLCVIGPSGALEPCGKAYDTRVAGVVAGAGDLHPGIVLGQGTVAEQSVALSITGRVWCKVDAGFGPIVPGDLVTTSTTPGHGMRADDRSRLTGAIAGKSLAALPTGCDFIPILVGLQ